MRYFNTSGPCNPTEHYTVLRKELIAQGLDKVHKGRYLTIFAPRQAGKTTYFQLLLEELRKDRRYTPIWISSENLLGATKKEFYEVLNHKLGRELAEYGVKSPLVIRNQLHLARFFEEIRNQCQAVVMVIDEFEGIPKQRVGELMHTFRAIYHERKHSALHSLILVGVSTIADLIVSASTSPFNIVGELKIPYFSSEEVSDLIGQYTRDNGQPFDREVVKAIYENTGGQPGLVSGLCAHLVEQVATDRTKPVTMDDFYRTLKHFLTERFDKNILNIVQKARAKQPFMLKLLFADVDISFTVDDPDIGYLYANGVVENVDGYTDIAVPLYKKRLLTAFRPTVNGEIGYYVSAHDTFNEYFSKDGLNLKAILQRYVEYVGRRGYQAFDTKHLKEGAWHYSLDGFINFFVERLGGQTFTEVPSGRGRTDIMILFRNKKYIIETKIFTDQTYFQQGKRQLAEYLKTEGLEVGYYVVFSKKHAEDDVLEEEEVIDGKRIVTRIIRVNFERPSRRKKKKK
ncbi:AAA-like domain-containing protein [candidate division KSB1 bacterium]|nr:AAA-like domain-containing protein [candidate division KSB1 bacterium]